MKVSLSRDTRSVTKGCAIRKSVRWNILKHKKTFLEHNDFMQEMKGWARKWAIAHKYLMIVTVLQQ